MHGWRRVGAARRGVRMTGSIGLLRRRRDEDLTTVEPAGAERRRSVRHTTVFQVAKLITPAFQELCILRDISATGLRAEVYREVAEGDAVSIEFRTGHRVSGKIVWVRDGAIGVHFDQEVSVVEILSHSSFDDRIGRIRPPRLDVDLEAKLRIGLKLAPVRVLDASQAGVKIAYDQDVRIEQACEIMLPGLNRRAVVRWQRQATIGLMFCDPLPYPDFVQWRLWLARQEGAPTS